MSLYLTLAKPKLQLGIDYITYSQKLHTRRKKVRTRSWTTQHWLIRAEIYGFQIQIEKEKVYNRITIHKLKIEGNAKRYSTETDEELQGERKTN